MKIARFDNALRCLSLLVPVTGLGALLPAQADTPDAPRHLEGLINDYSPAHVMGVPVKGGPYEMRGRWWMEVHRRHDDNETATFAAALNMETTDAGAVDQDNPLSRGAHTHHIAMTGPLSRDTSSCPVSDPSNPPIEWQFTFSGLADITGNGNIAPFQKKSGPSELQVCVGGGGDGTLALSNIALVFGAPANTHFGPQPIHGVVARCGREHEAGECSLDH
jgi:hypothetical protein